MVAKNYDRLQFRIWDEIKNGYWHTHEVESLTVFLLSHLSENKVIEQATGLNDNNGNSIYEGDIVKMEADCMCADVEQVGKPCIVEWGDFGFYFHYPQIEGEKECACWNECAEYEVIGNIHENPELLEGK